MRYLKRTSQSLKSCSTITQLPTRSSSLLMSALHLLNWQVLNSWTRESDLAIVRVWWAELTRWVICPPCSRWNTLNSSCSLQGLLTRSSIIQRMSISSFTWRLIRFWGHCLVSLHYILANCIPSNTTMKMTSRDLVPTHHQLCLQACKMLLTRRLRKSRRNSSMRWKREKWAAMIAQVRADESKEKVN